MHPYFVAGAECAYRLERTGFQRLTIRKRRKFQGFSFAVHVSGTVSMPGGETSREVLERGGTLLTYQK